MALAFPILRVFDNEFDFSGLIYSALAIAGSMMLGTSIAMIWCGARRLLLAAPILISTTTLSLGIAANLHGEALVGLLVLSLLASGVIVSLAAHDPPPSADDTAAGFSGTQH